jgi:hypothetical protein
MRLVPHSYWTAIDLKALDRSETISQPGKNFIKALYDAGYNLKHFVTATPAQFAHNQFNDFNTYVIGSVCVARSATDGRQNNAEALQRDIRVGIVGRFLLLALFHGWSPRANPVACGF